MSSLIIILLFNSGNKACVGDNGCGWLSSSSPAGGMLSAVLPGGAAELMVGGDDQTRCLWIPLPIPWGWGQPLGSVGSPVLHEMCLRRQVWLRVSVLVALPVKGPGAAPSA